MSLGFLFLASVLVIAVVGWLLAPILRAADASVREGTENGERLAERLAAIETERAAGLLDDAGAEEASLEARRAILKAAEGDVSSGAQKTDPKIGSAAKAWRFAAVIAAGLIPFGVGLGYLAVGSPEAERFAGVAAAADGENTPADPGAAIASMDPAERSAAIGAMVDGLAARLADAPDDPAGWRMLARSQAVLGRYDESAQSYRRLLALTPGADDDWRNFANAKVAALPNGSFPGDAEFFEILDELDRRAPGEPMTLFYRGGALSAVGDPSGAVKAWRALKATLPADAPILGVLDGLIAQADAAAAGAVPDESSPEKLDANP
ncbi:MAG: c-type cytochrome biogenesis protein CcmI [Pseudomonadota bacterium]